MTFAQRGVVLFIALIVLVAMSLAGLALMRSVDSGTLIASNLAFRQNATHSGDTGIEEARTWLMGQPGPSLYNNQTNVAYFAHWASEINLLGTDPDPTKNYDWNGGRVVSGMPAGYTARYVIHRLCEDTGNPASITCVKQSSGGGVSSGGPKGVVAHGAMGLTVETNALYRITVRTVGPRNTISIVQAVTY
jgi:Tfp pilus assembly protein PilX